MKHICATLWFLFFFLLFTQPYSKLFIIQKCLQFHIFSPKENWECRQINQFIMLPIKNTVLHFFYKECIQLEGIFFFKSYFIGFLPSSHGKFLSNIIRKKPIKVWNKLNSIEITPNNIWVIGEFREIFL